MQKIMIYLKSNGFVAQAKTIKDSIEAPIFNGMDVKFTYNKGYCLKSKDLSISISKMLAYAIGYFCFLTISDSEKLLKLLENLCSVYEVPQQYL